MPVGRRHNGLSVTIFAIALVVWSCTSAVVGQTIDDDWVFSINGRTTRVNPDGSFVVHNVSSPDKSGPNGSGPPDFKGDDLIRATGVRTRNGVTRYAYSDFFRICQDQTVSLTGLVLRDIPLPQTVSIDVEAADPVLTTGSTQLTTTATLSNGSVIDVSNIAAFTTYRSSNPAILKCPQMSGSNLEIAF